MSSETKAPAMASDFEVESHEYQAQLKTIRVVDGARVGLTTLALLCGVTILGTSGNALYVYNTTSVNSDFNLSLWPDQFDLRPTVALVAGSSFVVFSNLISLVFSHVKVIRHRVMIHTPTTFAAPFIGFIAALVAMALFYAVNTSTTVDTLQSWTCMWSSVAMTQKPYFGMLCRQSETALYLSIILVPLEAIILSVAGYQMTLEKKASSAASSRKRGSPALS